MKVRIRPLPLLEQPHSKPGLGFLGLSFIKMDGTQFGKFLAIFFVTFPIEKGHNMLRD